MNTGTLISIDGMGGAGKTTVAHLVADALQREGIAAQYTCEPSDSELGRCIRAQLPSLSPLALACLVAADRYEHIARLIRPSLARGEVVVCDRYILSSFVLQTLDGVPESFVEQLAAETLRPGLAIVLTVEPQIAWSRIVARGHHGRFEQRAAQSEAEFGAYVATAARVESAGWDVEVIETSARSAEAVAAEVMTMIRARQLR